VGTVQPKKILLVAGVGHMLDPFCVLDTKVNQIIGLADYRASAIVALKLLFSDKGSTLCFQKNIEDLLRFKCI
jgi:hypothetical protein